MRRQRAAGYFTSHRAMCGHSSLSVLLPMKSAKCPQGAGAVSMSLLRVATRDAAAKTWAGGAITSRAPASRNRRTMKIAQIDPAPERRKGSDREPIFAIEPIEDLTIIGPRQIERAPIPPRENRRSAPFGVCRWRAADSCNDFMTLDVSSSSRGQSAAKCRPRTRPSPRRTNSSIRTSVIGFAGVDKSEGSALMSTGAPARTSRRTFFGKRAA